MAKKKNNVLFGNKKIATESAAEISAADELVNDETLPLDMQNFDSEIDNLRKNNARLVQENSELLERLEKYIVEIDELRADKSNNSLSTQLAELRTENDSYLMKISELTFENAKLTAQIQELTKNIDLNVNKEFSQNINKINSTKVYDNMYKNNGYTSWN